MERRRERNKEWEEKHDCTALFAGFFLCACVCVCLCVVARPECEVIEEFGVCMWGLWNAVVSVSVYVRQREKGVRDRP